MSNRCHLLQITPDRTFVAAAAVSALTKRCSVHRAIYALGTQRSVQGLTMVIKLGLNMQHLISVPLGESDP